MLLMLIAGGIVLGWYLRDLHLLNRVLHLLHRAHAAHRTGIHHRARKLYHRARTLELLMYWEDDR